MRALKSAFLLGFFLIGACGSKEAIPEAKKLNFDGSRQSIRVAVASNFADTIKDLANRFTEETGHEVILAFGSSGKHFAQISHGAPFDVFFSADMRRPQLLEGQGAIVPGSRFTYAVGKVILWSPKNDYVNSTGQGFEDLDFRYIALANPKLAPYGRAAQEVMEERGVWQQLADRLVRGENIGQAFQFVMSGNADLGFVALSQVKVPGQELQGSWWLVPQELYSPIEQQAVQLKDNPTVAEFLAFVQSDIGLEIIREYGYGTP